MKNCIVDWIETLSLVWDQALPILGYSTFCETVVFQADFALGDSILQAVDDSLLRVEDERTPGLTNQHHRSGTIHAANTDKWLVISNEREPAYKFIRWTKAIETWVWVYYITVKQAQ